MDWFLYDNGLRHERVKGRIKRHYLEIEFSDLFEFDHNTRKIELIYCPSFNIDTLCFVYFSGVVRTPILDKHRREIYYIK